jgi:hypothetical protein
VALPQSSSQRLGHSDKAVSKLRKSLDDDRGAMLNTVLWSSFEWAQSTRNSPVIPSQVRGLYTTKAAGIVLTILLRVEHCNRIRPITWHNAYQM